MKTLANATIHSLTELDDFTKSLVSVVKPGMICLFYAEMGAGKTTFVKSFMSHLGIDSITSPTYTLINEYHSNPPVYHMDLYRLESEAAIDSLDLEYYFSQSQYLFFIEWAEKLIDINFPHIAISITQQDSKRVIDVSLR
ncbi:MAG: tRNA (adenosine(37)-N6)-threonylcarbamoyltransferase complex ATPase subunit type 1 TsaE [Rickettsiales bacterium]|nr:tRNA (adenosine(37)-N6)-threonylcarbamoyltransferase complex ATPase subunit type 1 TsaE [Rickettsiales bacterium]|tara:strand:- start:7175 stop:7594 length:420 start_codon:yes stop_codon:yes gene_type:complete